MPPALIKQIQKPWQRKQQHSATQAKDSQLCNHSEKEQEIILFIVCVDFFREIKNFKKVSFYILKSTFTCEQMKTFGVDDGHYFDE